MENDSRLNSGSLASLPMNSSRRPQIAPLLQVPINQLFIPRPPLVHWEPLDVEWKDRAGVNLSPVAPFVQLMQSPEEEHGEIVETSIIPTAKQRKEQEKRNRSLQNAQKIAQQLAEWNPDDDPKIASDSDPFRTLIVARLSWECTEKKLAREFERFGPVKSVRIVTDSKTGRPRGYAFVEYERERDAKAAYKEADGMKIEGRRVAVDFERGRTVKDWKPRRFGGGLGSTRK